MPGGPGGSGAGMSSSSSPPNISLSQSVLLRSTRSLTAPASL